MRQIALALAFNVLGMPAFATTLVVHGGVGRDCYLETLRDSASAEQNQQSLRICDQAVEDARVDPGSAYDYAAALANRADVKLRMQDFQGVIADAEKPSALVRFVFLPELRKLVQGAANRSPATVSAK